MKLAPGKGKGRLKRAKVSKPEADPEYFPEKRNLEDLWKHVFLVGRGKNMWDNLDMVYQYKWNFSNLEDAFEEGGELYNKKVYLFGGTEFPMVPSQGQLKLTMTPFVVVVVSPFPSSDKIGISSVQRGTEDIVPMKRMKMDWVPYIPLENRETQVERLKTSQIFILSCNQRRAALKQMKLERVKKFDYCSPYFYQPLQEDKLEQSTVVDIVYPIKNKQVIRDYFDWEFDELEEFTDQFIEQGNLPADQKDSFKDFVEEEVRKAKKTNREAREARIKARAEMSEKTRAAFQNMRFYKFYLLSKKGGFINRYYRKAHRVL